MNLDCGVMEVNFMRALSIWGGRANQEKPREKWSGEEGKRSEKRGRGAGGRVRERDRRACRLFPRQPVYYLVPGINITNIACPSGDLDDMDESGAMRVEGRR